MGDPVFASYRRQSNNVERTFRRNTMQQLNYQCPKCANTDYKLGEFRAAGGFVSKVFDVQNKKFTTVTCSQCTYTEIFQAESSMLGNIFDFFTG
ncbi:zinc ribbon domain-containing protein [candidate division KSB1 bacterium]